MVKPLPNKSAKIIPLAQPKFDKEKKEDQDSLQEAAYYYTLDLLMEDFGKQHESSFCALCEPMKVMGLHRDEVIASLNYTLFTTFFPDFEEYMMELKETMVHRLLRRQSGSQFKTWQEKMRHLVDIQIKKDAESFLKDIEKHLKKHTGFELPPARAKAILAGTLKKLQALWVPQKFTH